MRAELNGIRDMLVSAMQEHYLFGTVSDDEWCLCYS